MNLRRPFRAVALGGGHGLHATLSALRLLTDDVTAVVTVADSGSGVKAEHLERIFERFFRADAARTRGDGSGVGLTIARGLARAMRGDVTVSSVLGEGSTFTWTVPVA